MNKPASPIETDHDFGPLDEHGQQIWSPEEEAAMARLIADPAFWAAIAEGEADLAAGRVHSHEEVVAMSEARRQRYQDARAR